MHPFPTVSPRLRLAALAAAVALTAGSTIPAPAFAGPDHMTGQMSGQMTGQMPGQMPTGGPAMAGQGQMMEGHEAAGHMAEYAAVGEPGKAADVTRTITVTMHDNYFEPKKMSVKVGETIRFKITNKGHLLHGFVLGTPAMHNDHQAEMMEMMDMGMMSATHINWDRMHMQHAPGGKPMTHDDPNGAMVEPGKSAEVIWKFTKPMQLEFACDMPGHYQSGMKGPINVH